MKTKEHNCTIYNYNEKLLITTQEAGSYKVHLLKKYVYIAPFLTHLNLNM